MSKRLAGVQVLPVGAAPPYHLFERGVGIGEQVRQQYERAQAVAAVRAVRRAKASGLDDRIARLRLYNPEHDGPMYDFVLTRKLVRRIQARSAQKGAELTQDELLIIALGEAHDAAEPDFAPDALNAVNASYYQSRVAFRAEAGLADLFAVNRPLNQALGGLLAEAGRAGTLRVKELCAGGRVDHWHDLLAGIHRAGQDHVEVVLTDFVKPRIRRASKRKGVRLTAEAYSLFDPLPSLPPEQKFDALLTTYGFDSVW